MIDCIRVPSYPCLVFGYGLSRLGATDADNDE